MRSQKNHLISYQVIRGKFVQSHLFDKFVELLQTEQKSVAMGDL